MCSFAAAGWLGYLFMVRRVDSLVMSLAEAYTYLKVQIT